jgi:hypothetical protein
MSDNALRRLTFDCSFYHISGLIETRQGIKPLREFIDFYRTKAGLNYTQLEHLSLLDHARGYDYLRGKSESIAVALMV